MVSSDLFIIRKNPVGYFLGEVVPPIKFPFFAEALSNFKGSFKHPMVLRW